MYKIYMREATKKKSIKSDERYQGITKQMESCSMFMDRKLSIVTMAFLPNFIYRFNSALIKIPASYFVATKKLIL